jgi:hypothetical protein
MTPAGEWERTNVRVKEDKSVVLLRILGVQDSPS